MGSEAEFVCVYLLRLRWPLLLQAGFSLAAVRGATLHRGARSSHCSLLLQSAGSRVCGLGSFSSRAPEHRLSRHGTWAELLCGTWDLPSPRTGPVSPYIGR